jgi:hypothetical protein
VRGLWWEQAESGAITAHRWRRIRRCWHEWARVWGLDWGPPGSNHPPAAAARGFPLTYAAFNATPDLINRNGSAEGARLEAEPTRGLEPRAARLQEAFVPCIYCLVKVLTSSMAVAAFRGSLRHEFDDTADDRLSTVDGTEPPKPLPDPPLSISRRR